MITDLRRTSPQRLMFLDFFCLRRRLAYLVAASMILIIYSYPAVRTAVTTESMRLPAVSAPDLGLYLSLSRLHRNTDGAILNPYYHIPVPYPVSYLKFRLAPSLFGLLDSLFGGKIWLALFTWNLLWWSLLCLSAIWLFHRELPSASVELVLAGLSLLMLFSLDGVGQVMAAWTHHLPRKLVGGLPFIRPFTPQFIMPFFIGYVTLQICALRETRLRAWGAMALLQFVAFAAFPYATLMMAGTTAVAALWYAFTAPRQIWRVAVFLFVCAIPDIAFALHGSGGFRISFPDETSVFRFQPFLIPPTIGKLWSLTAILVIATASTKKLRPEVKWTLVGLGLTTLLLKLGDVFVSERLFFFSDHIGYFYQPTVVILLIFLASAYVPIVGRSLGLARIALFVCVVLCFVYGLLMAEGNYRTNLPYNLEQSDLARWVSRGEVSADDLIITRFEGTAYDDCEWIPLLSTAEVLYCRNAQLALSPEQNRDVQRLREVLYLYFDGKDHRWLETTTQFERFGLYGELSSYRQPGETQARIVTLRNTLRPIFDQVENNDPSIRAFFRRFRRVWIVQNRQGGEFVSDRLESYLKIKDQEIAGNLLLTASEPK